MEVEELGEARGPARGRVGGVCGGSWEEVGVDRHNKFGGRSTLSSQKKY